MAKKLPPEMKVCGKCKTSKCIDLFHNSKNRRDGKHPNCKDCRKTEVGNPEVKKRWHEKHVKGKALAPLTEEQIVLRRAKKRLWYEKNKDRLKVHSRSRYVANREIILAAQKERYARIRNSIEFKAASAASCKSWINKNRHIRTWRNLLRRTLEHCGEKKNDRTIKMLGYEPWQLKEHIQSLWTPGMTWENYGEWHIDHIKPISEFASTAKPVEVNALSNLRPLWATTRVIDGVEYEGNLNRRKNHE